VCAIRLVIFMRIHPLIAGITRTFELVGKELLNFVLSFGVLFSFLAFVARIRLVNLSILYTIYYLLYTVPTPFPTCSINNDGISF
jgi:hypothetical protein